MLNLHCEVVTTNGRCAVSWSGIPKGRPKFKGTPYSYPFKIASLTRYGIFLLLYTCRVVTYGCTQSHGTTRLALTHFSVLQQNIRKPLVSCLHSKFETFPYICGLQYLKWLRFENCLNYSQPMLTAVSQRDKPYR